MLSTEANVRLNSLLKRRKIDLEDTPPQFSDIIKVFEADAYFKGKWQALDSVSSGKIFNDFDNRAGECTSYFQVDSLDTRVTTVVVFFADDVAFRDSALH